MLILIAIGKKVCPWTKKGVMGVVMGVAMGYRH